MEGGNLTPCGSSLFSIQSWRVEGIDGGANSHASTVIGGDMSAEIGP